MTQLDRRAFLGAGAALGISALPGWALAQGEGPIRIGIIIPLTGATSQFGATMSQAAQIAVAEINAAGGVRGRKVEVIIEDDQSNPEAAVRAARKLIDVDRVVAIGGSYASAVTRMCSMQPVSSHSQMTSNVSAARLPPETTCSFTCRKRTSFSATRRARSSMPHSRPAVAVRVLPGKERFEAA